MDKEKILEVLESRFKENRHRHREISWEKVKSYLESNESIISKLEIMEESGGEPDLIYLSRNKYIFYADMSKESPSKRRSICYDEDARINRKKNSPETSAEELTERIGVKIMSKEIYGEIQDIEDIDLKTSTWLLTKKSIRKLGGAIFGDKRYGETFIYHNGADSYYKSRGVRFVLEIPDFII